VLEVAEAVLDGYASGGQGLDSLPLGGSRLAGRRGFPAGDDDGMARSARPDSVTLSRIPIAAISTPASPAGPAPGTSPGTTRLMHGSTPDSAARVKPEHATSTARGRPQQTDGADRPSEPSKPTVLAALTPVRYTSVDTATRRRTAPQDDTPRDRAETPR
jgi:hypothetical protein